jgi:hypothetical protein
MMIRPHFAGTMRPAVELPRQVGGFLHEPELFRLAQVKKQNYPNVLTGCKPLW